MRIILLAVVLVLSGASSAAAAPVISLRVAPSAGAILGDEHRVFGAVQSGETPLPGQVVVLEARPAGRQAFRTLDAATTGARGEYRFDRRFDRNQTLRVTAAGATATARAFVFPRARLTVRTVRRNVVRITQSFPAVSGLRVNARTSFYLGRARARTAPFVKRATVRRSGRRHVARATIRVPVAYKRRFSYAACLQARPGSALGDPEARCPRRSFRF
jgi:hypothetical protein